ncbi:MAG: HXXEE domain-containing protein [Chloroflexota bacterium]
MSHDVQAEDPSSSNDRFTTWIMGDTHWSRAGLVSGLVLMLIGPLVRSSAGRVVSLVYYQLPLYMFHQYEEHGHGAFKREVNRMLPSNRAPLTDRKIFWINIAGVWGVDLAALYLTRYLKPAAGLAAPYLAVINGGLHVGGALRGRRYNPGLWTSILFLLPFGGRGVWALARETKASRRDHARGIGVAVLVHAITLIAILRKSPR